MIFSHNIAIKSVIAEINHDISDEQIAASVLIQLTRPRQPDTAMVLEAARQHTDDRHREVTMLLRELNSTNLSDHVLLKLSAFIHVSCEWAWHYGNGRKTKATKTFKGWTTHSYPRKYSSSHSLKRLLQVNLAGDLISRAKIISDLSPRTFSELISAGDELGMDLNCLPGISCRECVHRAAQRALKTLATGRPRLREINWATKTVVLAYRLTSGRSTSGRGIASSSTDAAGKPIGELHSLLMKIGTIYDLRLVTSASDDRLRKPRS